MHSLARSHLPHWTPDFELSDVPELIEQIRLRLLPKRGVFALPEEILITVGAQHAYYLLAEALFDETQRVGLEEPGHPHARNSFALRHPRCVPVAVDEQGLVVERMPAVDYVFVTPSHQSPTTSTLSLERRKLLLKKAEAQNFVVIEDDYEAENLYEGDPMPALKSLDKVGRVIYVGSVSKSLSPTLRLGYIVAPRALIAELRELRHAMVRHPSAFLQHTFALFLSLGHHDAHARRVNHAMQERMALVARDLVKYLPDCEFTLPSGGASVWVRAPGWVDSAELALIAREHGVLIEAGEAFFMNPPYPCPYFRLRLSSIAAEQISEGIKALGLAMDALARAQARLGANCSCWLNVGLSAFIFAHAVCQHAQNFKHHGRCNQRGIATRIKRRRHFNHVATHQVQALQHPHHALCLKGGESTNFRGPCSRCVYRVQCVHVKTDIGLPVANDAACLGHYGLKSHGVKLIDVNHANTLLLPPGVFRIAVQSTPNSNLNGAFGV